MTDFLSSHFTSSGLGVGLVALLAIFAIARGVLRLVKGVICLGLGFAAGAWAFIHGQEFLGAHFQEPSTKLLIGLSTAAGAVGHLGSKFVADKLMTGLAIAGEAGQGMGKMKAALLSLLPSSFVVWVTGILVRLGGSLTGIAHAETGVAGESPWLAQLRDGVNSSFVGHLLDATDPISSNATTRLAEILISSRHEETWQRVERDARFAKVLATPAFRRLRNDHDVKRTVARSDYPGLLLLPEVKAAAEDPALKAALDHMPEARVKRAEAVR